MFPFYRTEHKYWERNATHKLLNEFIDPLGSLWNQARAGPFRQAENTLQMRWSLPVLWSYLLVEASYVENHGITKPRVGGGG